MGAFIGSVVAIFTIWILVSSGLFNDEITINQDFKSEYEAIQEEYELLEEQFDEYKERTAPVCEVDCGSTGTLYFMLGFLMYVLGMATIFAIDPIKDYIKKRKEE